MDFSLYTANAILKFLNDYNDHNTAD